MCGIQFGLNWVRYHSRVAPKRAKFIIILIITFMKKQALSALVLVGFGVVASPAFADSETSASQTERPAHRTGTGSEGSRHSEVRAMEFKQFLRTDLTSAETATLTGAIESNRTAMKALSESLKAGTVTQADFDAQSKSLREAMAATVLQYVAIDKVESFKTAISKTPTGKKPESMEKRDRKTASGSTDGQDKRISKKASLLPANIGAALENKLSAYSSDTERRAWLDAVITKVETMETKAKKTKTKNLLQEFKNLLQEKMDAIDDEVSSQEDEDIEAIFE